MQIFQKGYLAPDILSHINRVLMTVPHFRASAVSLFSPLLAMFVMVALNSASAQVGISGGCSSITVTQIPNYSNTLFAGGAPSSSSSSCNNDAFADCARVLGGVPNSMKPKYVLDRLINGQFLQVTGEQFETSFANQPKGFYRVRATIAVIDYNDCPKSPASQTITCIFNTAGQLIGTKGIYPSTPQFTSNTAMVGVTDASDNEFTFTESFPSNGTNQADANENVLVVPIGDQEYNLRHLAVFEFQNGQNTGYASTNWQTAPLTTFSLNDFWGSFGNGPLKPFATYEIQLATENSQCRNAIEFQGTNTWNAREIDFFICPTGTGCLQFERGSAIRMYPNPASSEIQVEGLVKIEWQGHQLEILDALGRIVTHVTLTDRRVDVSNLDDGVYFARIILDETVIHNQRIIIAK